MTALRADRIGREQFAPRLSADVLRVLSQRATPGPWDAFGGHVSAIAIPPTDRADKYSREAADSYEYYGGLLVCESCGGADALLIAAMRNMVPSLVEAHLALLEELKLTQTDLRYARMELAEAKKDLEDERDLVALIRAGRYQQPAFPLARIESIRAAS